MKREDKQWVGGVKDSSFMKFTQMFGMKIIPTKHRSGTCFFIVYGFHAESSWLNSLRIITNIFHVKCDPFAHLFLVWCGWYDFDVIKHCLHVKPKYTMSRSKFIY